MLHTRTLRALALLAATLSAGNACTTAQNGKNTDAAANGSKQQITKTLADVGLDAAALDKTVDPCSDFYAYACGGWEKSTEIPADKSRWNRSFSVIDQNVEKDLRDILDEASKNLGKNTDPAMEKLGAFFAAAMDEAAIEAAGLKPIEPLLNDAKAVKDRASLEKAIFNLHQHQIWALFSMSGDQDLKTPSEVIAYFDQAGLGLPDRDYYFKDDDKSKEIRTKYVDHVAKMFVLAGWPEADAKKGADNVMKLETQIAKVSKTNVERRDPQGLYNRVERDGLVKLAPQFPWVKYLESLKHPSLTTISVTSTTFFEGINTLLSDSNVETSPSKNAQLWRDYLTWQVLDATANTLPKKFVDQNFAMLQVLTGQPAQEERWKRAVSATDAALGELIGQPFVARRFAGNSKQAAEGMVLEISNAFGENVKNISWMDDATKQQAEKKRTSMVYKIGYPNKWREYNFTIDAKNYAGNVLAANAAELQRSLDKIGKPVDRDEWLMSPATVNAYYNPVLNEMVFPAAILQPPFFNVNAHLPVNMGGMGMVVGHELTHGFDDEGSQFAADGSLTNWWSPSVREEFEKKTKCVVEQYSQYSPIKDVKLNGELTLGENIADIGGVKLAFQAYRNMRKNAKEEYVAEGFNEDQQFFLSVGQIWCAKAREEAARMLAQVDPHSPPRFRVNGSLSNTPEFAKAFGCAVGTPMNPAGACKVW